MNYKTIITILLSACFCASCVEVDEFNDTTSGNVEALWKIMDEHYCFFDYKKQELGVDWNEVHARYAAQATRNLSSIQEFDLLSKMIGELKDGHVNLSSSFDTGRNWTWKEDYPTNFSDTLQRIYLGTDYRTANGLSYRILDDNVGYLYCGTFQNDLGASTLDNILILLNSCNGLIIDVRSNSGGKVTSAETLAGRFTNETTHVGYLRHKTGPGHNEFSEMKPQYIKPALGVRWQKQIVVLTNRGVYSAANEFVKYMKELGKAHHNITIVGDKTGGGAGLPYSAELPNGWAVRFSACPMYDASGVLTEHGVEPDHYVNITDEDFLRGRDTIIEYARKLLK